MNLITGAKFCFISFLATLGWFFKRRGILILTYHSIDESRSINSVSHSMFQRQMEYLKKNGYQTISLEAAVMLLESQKPLPQKSVVLTFDDGLKNNYTLAFPILKEYGFTATVFLVTQFIDSVNLWDKNPDIPELPLLSWDEIKEMSRYGMTFGAHTATHPHLPQLSDPEIRREIETSINAIAAQLGKPVRFFCYPYGEWDQRTKAILKQLGIKAACTTLMGRNHDADELLTLKRMGINRFSNFPPEIASLAFRACLSGTLEWYFKLKSHLSMLPKTEI